MSSRIHVSIGLLLVLLFALPDTANALPWRRRRTTTYHRYASSPVSVAQKTSTDSANLKPLRVFFDYDRARPDGDTFVDRVRVFLRVRDERVLQAEGPLVAEVNLTDLTDPDASQVRHVPVSLEKGDDSEEAAGVLELVNPDAPAPSAEEGEAAGSEPVEVAATETVGTDRDAVQKTEVQLKPAGVYRLFVNLHQKSPTQDGAAALGRVPTPYYFATSGATRLDRARYHIVMRTFKEFYYTEKGWASDEDCPLDCHAFYRWATSFYTVGAVGRRANLSRLWGSDEESHSGAEIPELAKQGPVSGDYVRIPGHTFMLLAYDAEKHQVWTMESNFNRSVEVAIRPVSSGWTVGHLADEHILPEPFEVAQSE